MQTMQLARKECRAKGCLDVQKNDFGETLWLFRRSFIKMNKDNVDTRKGK